MFLWFPPPTKASWHNARESAESGGTIKLRLFIIRYNVKHFKGS